MGCVGVCVTRVVGLRMYSQHSPAQPADSPVSCPVLSLRAPAAAAADIAAAAAAAAVAAAVAAAAVVLPNPVSPTPQGKSTLLKLMARRQIPVPENIDVLLVEQEVVGMDDQTALQAVVAADVELMELR